MMGKNNKVGTFAFVSLRALLNGLPGPRLSPRPPWNAWKASQGSVGAGAKTQGRYSNAKALKILFFLSLSFFAAFFFFHSACIAQEELPYASPNLLPGVQLVMKTADFWIARHPYPDKIILVPGEIANFNLHSQDELALTRDMAAFSQVFPGKELKTRLQETVDAFCRKDLYLKDGSRARKNYFEDIKMNMDLESIPLEVGVRFGFIVHFADQRFLPTAEALLAEKGDINFDELQNSDLDIGTAVAVLHKSRDGKWLYTQSQISSGWVKAENTALCSFEEMRKYILAPSFVVATSAKANIFLDAQMKEFYGCARMGSRFALLDGKGPGVVQISLPMPDSQGKTIFKTAYLKKDDVSEGYLPYTARNTIEQAFKLLDAPYGWGGMGGEQDCSRFLAEIFATVGVVLPRDSKDQAKVGRLLAEFKQGTAVAKKIDVLVQEAVGGITILPLKGHIMLFLGVVGGKPFCIHETWSYREKQGGKEITRLLKRAVVSDLSLGEGTKKGSLLERLSAARMISK